MNILNELERTIADRSNADPNMSHTAKLLSGGRQGCAKKLGEEAVEAVIAGSTGSRSELVHEAADVLYHLLVLMAANSVSLCDVLKELELRQGTSGIEEKQRRAEDEV